MDIMGMTSGRLEGLELSYDKNTSSSFLVIKAIGDSQVLRYQSLMISSNKISHVIAFEMKQNDGNSYFYYNITSRLPLHSFMKRRKLTRNEFIRILSDIAGTVVNSAGYLLSATGFILNAGHVYLNPVTLDIQLIYVPLKRECDVSAEFRDFVIDLILNHAELEECGSDNFLQRILNFVKNELFNVSDFYLFLNKLNTAHIIENRDGGMKDDSEKLILNANKMGNRENLTGVSLDGARQVNSVSSSKDNSISSSKHNIEEKSIHKMQHPSIPLFVEVLALQAVIAATFLMAGRYLMQAGNSSITTYAALIMVALAIDVLLFKKLISPRHISNAGISEEKTEPIIAQKSDNANPSPGSAGSGIGGATFGNAGSINPEVAICNVENKGNYNTVMLSPVRREYPCLIGKYSAEMEEIMIDKPEYLIGRLEGQVDYVSGNAAVGKVHACILTKEDSVYISDLNSVNGTFINNTRIDSNKQYEIENNDIISFANSQYVFMKPF